MPLNVRCRSVDRALLALLRVLLAQTAGTRHPPGAMQGQPCPSPRSGYLVERGTLHPGRGTPVPPDDRPGDPCRHLSPRLGVDSSWLRPLRTLAPASLGLRFEEMRTQGGTHPSPRPSGLPQLFGRRQRAPGLGAQRFLRGPRLRRSGAGRAGGRARRSQGPHSTDARPGTGPVPSP